jgi:hypothetical protein
MPTRVLFVGGTGPVGQASVPHVLEAGHEVALAHSGRHEPVAVAELEHLHGSRKELLAPDGPAERWRPEVLIDTFAGGATAAKARELSALAERSGAELVVAVSSIDVYRHCADAGVDGHAPAELPRDPRLGVGGRAGRLGGVRPPVERAPPRPGRHGAPPRRPRSG